MVQNFLLAVVFVLASITAIHAVGMRGPVFEGADFIPCEYPFLAS